MKRVVISSKSSCQRTCRLCMLCITKFKRLLQDMVQISSRRTTTITPGKGWYFVWLGFREPYRCIGLLCTRGAWQMISFPYSMKSTSTIDNMSSILSLVSVVCALCTCVLVLIRGLIDALADQSTPPKIGATVLIRQVPNECMLYYRAGMTSHTRFLLHGKLSSARVNHAASLDTFLGVLAFCFSILCAIWRLSALFCSVVIRRVSWRASAMMRMIC